LSVYIRLELNDSRRRTLVLTLLLKHSSILLNKHAFLIASKHLLDLSDLGKQKKKTSTVVNWQQKHYHVRQQAGETAKKMDASHKPSPPFKLKCR